VISAVRCSERTAYHAQIVHNASRQKAAFLATGVRVTRNQSENYRGQGILGTHYLVFKSFEGSRWREGGAPVSTAAVLRVQVTDHMRLREILRIRVRALLDGYFD